MKKENIFCFLLYENGKILLYEKNIFFIEKKYWKKMYQNNAYFLVMSSQVPRTIFFVFLKLKKIFTLNAFFLISKQPHKLT